MADYKQADRPLTVTTPLGPDVLLLRGFSGREGISQLFRFSLDLIADSKSEIPFDQLLGKTLTVKIKLPDSERFFSGICMRFSQGEREPTDDSFTAYRAEIVPQFWMLTRRAQSRIFQRLAVPDILKKVLTGLTVDYKLSGTWKPRDFCVQYRESDFNFACRLMEEEGIFYFFKHSAGSHTMVVANNVDSHVDVPGKSTITYENLEGGFKDDDRIVDWEKVQEMRSGKYTLWDHTFEIPHQNLEAQKTIQESVSAGKVTHKLKLPDNAGLELYDFPGEYAQRFDGIDKGGGEQPADVQNIFEDNKRTVEIRMAQEAISSLVIRGSSNCRQMTSGFKFTLEKHFNADGVYVLTTVHHNASGAGDYRGLRTGAFRYTNHFECIPIALPFRPMQVTQKPIIQGSQSAVVVGPAGEEIFVDKYSRVKVQFHWDRQGKKDPDSSCWIRVATQWAGKQWGAISIPRIGQEVLVDFLEGDPDDPIIVGSIYNADMMPPYSLPANKTQSGIKSRSSLGGTPANFNEFRFEDKKGNEQVFLHAERNQDIEVEANETHWVGHDRTKTIDHDETSHIKHDRTETVDNNETITIHGNRTEMVDREETITIGGDRTEMVGKNETLTVALNRTDTIGVNEALTVGAARVETVGGAEAITVGGARTVTVGGAQTYVFGGALATTVGGNVDMSIGGSTSFDVAGSNTSNIGKGRDTEVSGSDNLKAGKKVTVDAGDEITLSCGAASIQMKKDGTISIKGMQVSVEAMGKLDMKSSVLVQIKGSFVKVN